MGGKKKKARNIEMGDKKITASEHNINGDARVFNFN